ncbi:RDD family protein [Pseudoxanthomonas sp. PXM03]|uniref:RDD family protein n=1 Tax=Pseudoxanthomonas sp. PXM03 TaxID=2769284 RepID=UPI00177D0DBE|nr:RDD family protein [Pseudoxanthomonas sp. PXM03]MBD9434734.1 RDD family protein [Pseudoxanthomonas sp. PXM03]
MTHWYYADAQGQRQGPFTAGELGGHVRQARLGAQSLVWREGLEDWKPLSALASELDLPVGTMDPPAEGADDATELHIPAADAPYAPPAAQIATEQHYVGDGDVVLAGFWRRLAALFIDSMVVGFAYYLVLIVCVVVLGVGGSLLMRGGNDAEGMAAMFGMMALVYLLYPVISAAYYVGFESSGKQATLGKMAVGIKVTDIDGRRLTLGRALLRWLAVMLNYLTLYIGYLIAAFTERKQGLHDMAVGTLVVDRWAYTAHPDWQQRGLGTATKVILAIAGVIYGLIFIAMMAAILIPLATQS